MHFFKGVSPWFLSTNGDFLIFSFLAKWMKKKCCFEGSERKEAFLDHKNIGLKNHQNLQFFKEVIPLFLSKNGDFLIFSFYAKLIKKKCFVKVPKEKRPF